MNEQLKSLRQQALNVMAFEHFEDEELVKLRAEAKELQDSIAQPLAEINRKVEKYLEQYIPDRLQLKDKQE